MTTPEKTSDSPEQSLAAAILRTLTSRATNSAPASEEIVRSEAQEIARQNTDLAIDEASRQWLAQCSLILAVYRQLLPLVGDSREAVDILRAALTDPFKTGLKDYMADRFGLSGDTPEKAFEHVAENFQTRGEERFGQAFTYVVDANSDARSFTNITKCFFNDFFRKNNAPELTPIFCAMDMVWADEMNSGEYDVRFERPTTLAAGSDACRFQFFKRTVV